MNELRRPGIKMKLMDGERASLGTSTTGCCHEARAAEDLAVGSLCLLQVSHECTMHVEWNS